VSYLLASIATIRYVLGDQALTVRWRHTAHVVPYAAIDEIVYDPNQPASGRGWELFWPGFYVYSRRLANRVLRVVATLDAQRRVAILTSGEAIELSPERPVLFLAELDRRRFGVSRGPVSETHQESPRDSSVPLRMPPRRPPPSADPRFRPRERRDDTPPERQPQPQDAPRLSQSPPPQDEPFDDLSRTASPVRSTPSRSFPEVVVWLRQQFRDQLLGDQLSSTLLAVGVIVPLLMVAFLVNQQAGLPDAIPLHWDANGAVDVVGEPRDLWRFPLMAGVLLVGNTAVATLLIAVDRFLTRLLLAATPVVQVLAFIALARVAL
jgi:hypothetical protein